MKEKLKTMDEFGRPPFISEVLGVPSNILHFSAKNIYFIFKYSVFLAPGCSYLNNCTLIKPWKQIHIFLLFLHIYSPILHKSNILLRNATLYILHCIYVDINVRICDLFLNLYK